MTVDKHCFDCKYAGMDMYMAPYCAHPKTLLTMPWGSTLARPSPSRDHCGEDKNSFESREEK